VGLVNIAVSSLEISVLAGRRTVRPGANGPRATPVWAWRLKNGLSVEQRIVGDELRAIKRYLGSRSDAVPWLFISERGQPLTRQSVNYLMATAGPAAHGAPFLRRDRDDPGNPG
jgi:hypothetical protein